MKDKCVESFCQIPIIKYLGYKYRLEIVNFYTKLMIFFISMFRGLIHTKKLLIS